ncbi:major outer membrane protein [Exilibacterium tricleocarpae]|nr:major outer membrane protein [Exilibacterium tricleocarpae]
MNNRIAKTFARHLLALAVAAGAAGTATGAESLQEALREGDVELSLRLRFEDVDIDIDGADSSDLTSLLTRLTFTSAGYNGFSTLIEMDDVTHLTDFEGGVADPEGTEVNQVYLAYTAGNTTVKYGRQRILLDNQRFVGGVGFRQNEQTYDGLSLTNKSLPDTTVLLAYVNNVNRIFGEDDPRGDHTNDTYLLNAKYSGFAAGTLTGYAYLIDNEDAPAFSSDTYGVRFVGEALQGKFKYTLEAATQSDAANNPDEYDATYTLLEASYKVAEVTLKGGYEVLGADGTDGRFVTPLATLHKFQGWADQFLGGGTGNLTGGIEDIYVGASTTLAGVNLSLVYHQLGADDNDERDFDDYGSEYGFTIAKKFGPLALSLKYADFRADDDARDFVDVSKLWLTAAAKF